MSGGPVFNEKGQLCGLMCRSWNFGDSRTNISYVASLWPMMAAKIDAKRADNPTGKGGYFVLELAKTGIIKARGFEKISIDELTGNVSLSQ